MNFSPLVGALAATAAWLAIGLLSLVPGRNALFARTVAFPLGALVGLALAVFGLLAVWEPAASLTLVLGLPDLPFHVRLDPLAGFFLFLLGAVSAGISVYAAGYFHDEAPERLTLIGLQYFVFLAAMALVTLAGRVANVIPVDVAVPGCPPTPVAIMQGILTAVAAKAQG